LAAAYAEVGDFKQAVECQERAIPLLQKMNPQFLPDAEARLALYRQNKPYREHPKSDEPPEAGTASQVTTPTEIETTAPQPATAAKDTPRPAPAPIPADPAPPLPDPELHPVYAGPGPVSNFTGTIQAAIGLAADQIQLVYPVAVQIPETHTRQFTVRVGDHEEARTEAFSVTKTVYKQATRTLHLYFVQGFDTKRKPVPSEKLVEWLPKQTTVLICPSEEEVDDAYMQLVKPETVVLKLSPRLFAAPMPAAREPIAGPAPAASPAANPALPDQPPAPLPAETSPHPAGPQEAKAAAPDYSGLPPLAGWATLKDGKLQLRRVMSSTVETTGMRTVTKGEQQECIPATMKRSIRREVTDEYDLSAVKFFATDGKPVPAVDVKKRLKQETAVAVSIDGHQVDPKNLAIISDDALVLVLPADAPPPIRMPVPATEPPT
jgi:hypothetical protein